MRNPPSSRAAELAAALTKVDVAAFEIVADWLRARPEEPEPSWPASERRAAAYLDRVAARDLPPQQRRLILEQAGTTLGDGDPTLTAQIEADLTMVAYAEGRVDAPLGAAVIARDLEAAGHLREAAEIWRALAWFGSAPGSERAVEASRAAANLSLRAGEPLRCALALVEAAMHLSATDAPTAEQVIEEARALAPGHPVIQAMADDTAARMATHAGDLDRAADHLATSAARPGAPDAVTLTHLVDLCATHLARGDWSALSAAAASAMASAADSGAPLISDLAQGYLGIAAAMTGEHQRAEELLEAALPVLSRQGQPLAGPVAATLGDLQAMRGQLGHAAASQAAAAAAYAEHGHDDHAADALMVAAELAAHAQDGETSQRYYLAAEEAYAVRGEVHGWTQAARGAIVALVDEDSADQSVARLDALPARAWELAQRHTGVEMDWDELDLQLACQGAQVLVAVGRVDDAIARLEAAEAEAQEHELTGHAWLLRTERGLVLADADRLDEAEPVVRPALSELVGLGESAAAAQAADVLAQALERASRLDEARVLRERYPGG